MLNNVTVVAGATYWTLNGVNVFSVNLVRGLLAKGISAHILLTEEDSVLVNVHDARMERAADVPYRMLPVERWRSWGAHWGAMVRYLERLAPCIYIPNYDWRHSCVSPLLSDRVGIVGIVHSDDPLHYDHVNRLGDYWNAIATTSETIARKTISLNPRLEPRTVVIPIGVDIPLQPLPFVGRPGEPLRLIYPGTIKQHQKRVLDLPKIMRATIALGVPAVMTVAGGGPDENALRAASQDLVEKGVMQFLGVVDHDGVLKLLEEHDVFIMTSEFEGMPNALLEAMGRGCVPLVTDMESAIPELIQDGRGGLIVPIGAIDLFAERIKLLHANPGMRREMALKAHEAVSIPKFGVHYMVQSYIDLMDRVFKDVEEGTYRRPPGILNHPPAQVAGINLFPVKLPYEKRGVGRFPSRFPDYREFKIHIKGWVRGPATETARSGRRVDSLVKDLDGVEVIVASPVWIDDKSNHFSEKLVRDLVKRGVSAHILLTEEETDRANWDEARLPPAEDVPFVRLPVRRTTSWGGHWGAMIRYLEERAPCVYFPNRDWRHSCVSPLLSNNVAIVGIADMEDPLHYEHVKRMGRYWNAILAAEKKMARKVKMLDPSLSSRISLVSPDSEDGSVEYVRLIRTVWEEVREGSFRRPEGILEPPPQEVSGISVFPLDLSFRKDRIGHFPQWHPDYTEFRLQTGLIGLGRMLRRLRRPRRKI